MAHHQTDGVSGMIKFHKDNTQASHDQIFVFGSNLVGIHGAGAANAAMMHYGAEWGKGIGLYGRSYAIPTKDANINTMRLSEIIPHIKAFVEYTKAHPELQWFVTRIGCGLAGFQDFQIAPYFKGAINCDFAQEWEKYL